MPRVRPSRVRGLLAAVFAAVACSGAVAQPEPAPGAAGSGFTLSPDGTWERAAEPDPDSDAGVMAEAARLIAEGEGKKAQKKLNRWIHANKRTDNDLLSRAYLLRGDAKLERGNEYDALYDYETVITDFPASDEYIRAVQREADIAFAYLDGLKRKFLGLRIDGSRATGEELLIRVQERLPQSSLAEDAAFRLAEHYYDRGEMRLASEMYSIFRQNYPESPRARQALLGQIFSNVAAFKGPAYDASSLLEAGLLIDRYRSRYPADAATSPVINGLDERIDESRAAQMLETAEWYIRTGSEPSGRFTLRRLIRKHPRSSAAQRAIDIMEERGWFENDGAGEPSMEASR